MHLPLQIEPQNHRQVDGIHRDSNPAHVDPQPIVNPRFVNLDEEVTIRIPGHSRGGAWTGIPDKAVLPAHPRPSQLSNVDPDL